VAQECLHQQQSTALIIEGMETNKRSVTGELKTQGKNTKVDRR